jgi:hypothetical protein
MIVDKEHDDIKYDQWWDFEGKLVVPRPDEPTDFANFLQVHHELRDSGT